MEEIGEDFARAAIAATPQEPVASFQTAHLSWRAGRGRTGDGKPTDGCVEQGGRTGLTGRVVAGLFLLALFFSPLIAMVGSYPPITALAVVLVAYFVFVRSGMK
jgi:hypothetical protein